MVADRLTVLDRRPDCVPDGLSLRGDGRVDFDVGRIRGDRESSRFRVNHDVARRQTVATTLAPPFGDQPLLLDQQGEVALQHPWGQLVRQTLANGADLHTLRVCRHDR